MDILFEALFELILEGSFSASKSKKAPLIIRYLFIFDFIFYIGIIGLSKNILAGIVLIIFGILFLTLSIIKFRKTYIEKRKSSE